MDAMMTAIAIRGGAGPAAALHAVRAPRPVPRDGEVLLRVHAAGINRVVATSRGAEKAALAEAVERVVWPWIEAGQVRAVIDRTFPLSDAAQAHAWLEGGRHAGKVVLVAAN